MVAGRAWGAVAPYGLFPFKLIALKYSAHFYLAVKA